MAMTVQKRKIDPRDQAIIDRLKNLLGLCIYGRAEVDRLLEAIAARLRVADAISPGLLELFSADIANIEVGLDLIEQGHDQLVERAAEIFPEFARFKAWRDRRRIVHPVPGQPIARQ